MRRPLTAAASRGARPAALVAAAGLAAAVLAGCSGGDEPATAPAPESSTTASSSTTVPSPTVEPETEPTTNAAVVTSASTAATAAAVAPATSALPAVVVAPRGPCHRIGDLAQSPDGSPLFCIEDPDAGPLWLPAPPAGGAPGGGLLGGPCIQEGVSVPGPGGGMLTCRLVGGGDTPGGLFWQAG
jgi:hypothetical protein